MASRIQDFLTNYYLDYDLSLLKKLTLVIPTYNRNYYLSRCLWYHAHFPFGQIIVADSSPDEKKIVNRETVAKIREAFGTNILYIEYEPETEKYGGDIYRKWGDAVQHVVTEYSEVVTDKEFLLPNSVVTCLQYLEEHKDHIACGGKKYSICLKPFRKISKSSDDYQLIQRKPNRSSETESGVLERLKDAFLIANAWDKNLLLTIHRTDVQKYVFDLLRRYEINDIRYGELICAYAGYLFGKFHYVDSEIYKIRDIVYFQQSGGLNPNKKSSESSNTRYPYLSEYSELDETNEFTERFIHCVSSELSIHTTVSFSDAEVVAKSITSFSILSRFDSGKTTVITKIFNRFPVLKDCWSVFPYSLKRFIGKIYSLIFNQRITVSNPLSADYSGDITLVTQTILLSLAKHLSDLVIEELA